MLPTCQRTVAVITDGEALQSVLMRHAEAVFGAGNTRGILYNQSDIHLVRLMQECDLFLLDLFRQYPGGLRAEGVALGFHLARREKRVLIFSPLSLSPNLSLKCYWDIADARSPRQAMEEMLTAAPELEQDWQRIKSVFHGLLKIPPQHKT